MQSRGYDACLCAALKVCVLDVPLFYLFKLFTQVLYSFWIAFSVFVYPLERQGRAYIVVNVLTEIQHIGFGSIALVKGSAYRKFELLETSVASHCHAAVYVAFDIDRSTVVGQIDARRDVGVEYLVVPKISKELGPCVPLKLVASGGQINQINYKGLQRY